MTVSGSTPLLQYWVAARPMPGQQESGDQYLVADFPGGALVAGIDGLGHGEAAAAAAKTAVATLAQHAHEPVAELLRRCHEQMRRTRGAVMTLVSFRAADSTFTWLGVGNVECMLLHANTPPGTKPSSLLLRGGIVGDRLPPLHPATVPVRQGDLLLLATDGIASAFIRELRYPDNPQQLVNQLFSRYARDTDDALILGVQWNDGAKMTATTGS
ncbi:MAG TPA: SpoIIE family protein phosphatase [Noviherbaspirillum sp.]|nr:SpoIIE family protein phosphatase [Noviherbaspirillum sp.]